MPLQGWGLCWLALEQLVRGVPQGHQLMHRRLLYRQAQQWSCHAQTLHCLRGVP